MERLNYADLKFTVGGVNDIEFREAIQLWKTKYPDFRDFKREVITSPLLEDFGNFMEEMWEHIIPVTLKEGFSQDNIEKRRLYFDCIGVETLFKSLNPTLLDSQTIKKKRMNWDDDNNEQLYEFEDTYELYSIPASKLQLKDRFNRENSVYAVRCKCTTTGREYWIYVPQEVAINVNDWQLKHHNETGIPYTDYNGIQYIPNPDAIRAIAWTVRIDVENTERIYRQGDIIVCKLGLNSQVVRPYHITKEQYLNLMYSET